MMLENYKSQINNLKNQRKFTIPSKLYYDSDYSSERRLILLFIASIFEKNTQFKNKDKKIQDVIIINIEKSCYNFTLKKSNELMLYIDWGNYKFAYQYQLTCNKITKNLDSESEVNNSYLIDKILNDDIDISHIAELSSDQLCPEKSDLIKQNLTARKSQKLDYKTSSLYTCKNCKKRSVTIKEYQGKSLDEGTNLSLTCLFCNYNWIVG